MILKYYKKMLCGGMQRRTDVIILAYVRLNGVASSLGRKARLQRERKLLCAAKRSARLRFNCIMEGEVKVKHLILTSVALASWMVVSPANATIFTLQDLNSTVGIDTASNAFDWQVGGISLLSDQSFWYRTGADTREHPLSGETITFEAVFDTNSNPGDDVLNVSYTRAGLFRADVRYSLQGSPPSQNLQSSNLNEQITITNLSSQSLSLNLFKYTDFDIAGAAGDTVSTDGSDSFFQFDNAVAISSTVNPTFNRWEIDTYPNILDKLQNDSIDNLSNSTTPLVDDDGAWAAQFILAIPATGSATINVNHIATVVPVPPAMLFLASGILALGLIRRRRTRRV